MEPVMFSFLLMNPSKKEIIDFRSSIEREVLYLAVDNATKEDIAKMRENIELFKRLPAEGENTEEISWKGIWNFIICLEWRHITVLWKEYMFLR